MSCGIIELGCFKTLFRNAILPHYASTYHPADISFFNLVSQIGVDVFLVSPMFRFLFREILKTNCVFRKLSFIFTPIKYD